MDMKTISRLPFNSRWLILFAVLAVAVAAEGRYHIIKKIPVPGDYGWDYLTADSEARRLYVSHDREVVVLDLDTNAVIGKIPGTSVHGIAIAKDFGRGFISCSDPGSIVIFDLKTLAVIERVPVGADPNVIEKPSTFSRLTAAANASRPSILRPARSSARLKVWAGKPSMPHPMTRGISF